MIDIFRNYILQREELLARIAQELELDETRQTRMETSYKAVSELLQNNGDFFVGLDVEIYSQGSVRIGTTVKPVNNEDFDLDTVLHIYDPYYNHTPESIYNTLVKALEKDSYYQSIMEKKQRCVRLNYKSDFHMDILPACMSDSIDKMRIKIPEKAFKSWSNGNPRGFADWFLNIAKSAENPLLKTYSDALFEARVDQEPLPNNIYFKTPLQRAVQLIKRYRDLYYQKKDSEYKVSSIVITTLVASFYNKEGSIYDTIESVIGKIKNTYSDAVRNNYRFRVLNPVDSSEDFTDSWSDKHYQSFYAFIEDFFTKWQNIKGSFEHGKSDYITLFGEGEYKKSLTEQIRMFSKASSDVLTKANGLIITDKAHTTPSGTISHNQGVKNEKHHNFGGLY